MNEIVDVPQDRGDRYRKQTSTCQRCGDPIWRVWFPDNDPAHWSTWWHGRPMGATRPYCYAETTAEP